MRCVFGVRTFGRRQNVVSYTHLYKTGGWKRNAFILLVLYSPAPVLEAHFSVFSSGVTYCVQHLS